jgi:hypothetical protein
MKNYELTQYKQHSPHNCTRLQTRQPDPVFVRLDFMYKYYFFDSMTEKE